MAKPTRISELQNIPANNLQGSDQFVVARGSGPSGQTYKVLASNLLKVANTPTINLNFDTSSLTLSANATTALTQASAFNVADSPTINLDWNPSTRTLTASAQNLLFPQNSPTVNLSYNSSTRTLSADASYLLTLINQLSTNMQTIGNYPYLEYTYRLILGSDNGQTLPENTITTLNLNTEVADTGNFGSISSNQITLAAGTYRYDALVPISYGIPNASQDVRIYLHLKNVTDNSIVSVGTNDEGIVSYSNFITIKLNGQFTIASSKAFLLQMLVPSWGGSNTLVCPGRGTTSYASFSDPSLTTGTTIKLWKVG